MAENLPNLPTGAAPPKPAEAAKVQPKKETVRINLPPKPTAAPTIKLPSPPPAAAAQTPAPPVPTGAPAATPVAAAAPAAPRAVSPAAPRAAAPPRPVVAGVSTMDNALGIVAAIAGVVGLVSVLLLLR